MAKDTYYFSHDYNARNDEKILELRLKYGVEGYGLFWMVVESMAENENGGVKATLLGGLSLAYGVAKANLYEFIAFCVEVGLFYENDGFYFSKRLLLHKNIRSSLSTSGKIGAEKRWGGHSHPNAKERKGNENNSGIEILENENAVLFADGTKQQLGQDQMFMLKNRGLRPQDIKKGNIY